jgi:hypothetical protein
MFRSTIIGIAASAALLGGCASKEALVGTAAGAAMGAAIGGGKLSTVAGGVVGYQAGKRYEERNR